MILTILVFLIILTVLVLIHEWGHYFAARKFNIKVEEFGFGIPPRMFGIKKGETIYSINWLPIGGFVKLYGEDEAGGGKLSLPVSSMKYQVLSKKKGNIHNTKYKIHDTGLERAFFAKPAWQRAVVTVAGVAMNSLLAVVIFYIFLFVSGFKTELPQLSDHKFFGVHQKNVAGVIVRDISKNSPASSVGLKPSVRILSINDISIHDTEEFVKIINQNKGKEISIAWQDLETYKKSEAKVTPRVSPPRGEGALGVAFYPFPFVQLEYQTTPEKLFSGISHPLNLLMYNLDVFGKLIQVSIEKKSAAPVGENVAGPVGISSIVTNILKIEEQKERFLQLLNFAGILSISLAFFNILPIPAVDGGRLFFILIELVSGKRVNQKIEGYAHAIGWIALLTLIGLVTIHDVVRLLGK